MQPLIRPYDFHAPVDVRHVGEAARVLQVSEFDIFALAYRFWYERELRQDVIDETFSDYILRQKVPSWVRDYCRRVLNLAAVGQLDPRDFGVDKPRVRRITPAEQLYASFATLIAFLIFLFFFS
ncbi:MAG: hypothetical protein ACE5K1_09690 [Acidiferrobacterales bacterium]